MAKAKDPNSKTAQQARSRTAKKAAATRSYNRDAAAAETQKTEHATAEPTRHEDIYDRLSVPHWRGQVSTQHMYHLMGYQGAESHTSLGQSELPGMEHPDALPTPKRWEDYSPSEQSSVHKAVGRFGVTESSAKASLGAQLDHAMVREGGHHASFYSAEGVSESGSNLPRTQLKQSAHQNKVSFGVQAMANSITSPRLKFVERPASGPYAGQVKYPNDDAATFAIKWSQAGHTGDDYVHHPDYHVPAEDKVANPRTGKLQKKKDDPRKYPLQGLPDRVGMAVDAVTAVRNGNSIAEAWGQTEAKSVGRSDYGDPKTAPFHNSWVDPHGSNQFWVSDTHSGPAAFAPHLRKDQEDKYMQIDGVHAFHDHVARQSMSERGLQSLSGTQSMHWSEEKTRSGSGQDVAEMTPKDSRKGQQFEPHSGQGKLF